MNSNTSTPLVGRRIGPVDERAADLAQEQRGDRPIAVVAIVTHLQSLGDEGLKIDRSPVAEDRCQYRTEHPVHPAESVDDLRPEGAVAQHLAEAFVQRRVRDTVSGGVGDDRHRHGWRGDSGHRANGPVVMAWRQLDLAPGGLGGGVIGVVGQTFVEHGSDDGAAHGARGAVPGDWRPGMKEGAIRHVGEDVPGDTYVDQLRTDRQHLPDGGEVGIGHSPVGGQRGQGSCRL